ncbi:hypothetical protein PPL_00694 [Heterostelium album PN500]|uniref:Protein kinase domain-containing protein n=1 Tax=Heterostelium pallidum (strain ATCC 26659 / Pp 5 / PN500) TaxID=670386 RepID=D3AX64_HETP5|nr:hypothetical protein PPL_00694 [Heterostelium album PN500]EFA86133.1 hypothetical protein PPL_00694 [Heterostelium album PN500]|eukprot:XP_020438238.1 hypothetical protein PPL_00694 [Heterostelium album PN500]
MFGDGTHYKLENTVKRAVTHYTKLIDANYHKLNFTIANSISQGVTVDCSALTRKFKSDWNLNPSNYVPPLYTVVHQHSTTFNLELSMSKTYYSFDSLLKCNVESQKAEQSGLVIKNGGINDLFVIISKYGGDTGVGCPNFIKLKHIPTGQKRKLEPLEVTGALCVTISKMSNNQYLFKTIELPSQNHNVYTEYRCEHPSLQNRATNEIQVLKTMSRSNTQILKLLFDYHSNDKSVYSTITEFGNMDIHQLCDLYQSNYISEPKKSKYISEPEKIKYIPEQEIWLCLKQLLVLRKEMEINQIVHCEINGSSVFVKQQYTNSLQLSLGNFHKSIFIAKNNGAESSLSNGCESENGEAEGGNSNNNVLDKENISRMKGHDGESDIVGIGKVIQLLLSCNIDDEINFNKLFNDKNTTRISHEGYSQELILFVKDYLLGAKREDIDTLLSILDEHLRKKQFTIFYNSSSPFTFQSDMYITVLVLGDHFDQELGVLPITLQSIKLGNRFNRPIRSGLPHTLKQIEFGDQFNQRLEVNVIPESVTTIIFGKEFNQSLQAGVLSSQLKVLIFGDRFNQVLKPGDLPPNLEKLKFGNDFNQPLGPGVIPSSLQKLQLGYSFNQKIQADTLSDNIHTLTFGECFQGEIENLPKGIATLEVPSSYSQNLPMEELPNLTTLKGVSQWIKIPESVTSLTFGRHFNQPILVGMLPRSLVCLEFGSDFNSKIYRRAIPNSLRTLIFGYSFNQPIKKLPSGIEVLTFGDSFNQPIDGRVLTKTMKSLSLGLQYKQLLPTLPSSTQTVQLSDGYPHHIHSSTTTPNLTSFKIGEKEYINYIRALNQNKIEYHFPDNSDKKFTILQLQYHKTNPSSKVFTIVNNTCTDFIVYIRYKNNTKQLDSVNHYLSNHLHNKVTLHPQQYSSIDQIIIMKFTNKILISNIFNIQESEPCEITLSVKHSFSFNIYNQTPLMFPVHYILSPEELEHIKEKNSSIGNYVCKTMTKHLGQAFEEIKALKSVIGNSHFVQYVTHENENNENNKYQFSEKKIWSYASQMVTFVQELDAKGILHGDIKPGNILLENNKLVLGDLGSNIITNKIQDGANLNNDPALVNALKLAPRGTQGFKAPETNNVDIGNRIYTIASDFYSIGSSLHLLMTTFGIDDKQYRIAFLKDPNKVQISSRYSTDLIIFIRKLLSIDPEVRGDIETFQKAIPSHAKIGSNK